MHPAMCHKAIRSSARAYWNHPRRYCGPPKAKSWNDAAPAASTQPLNSDPKPTQTNAHHRPWRHFGVKYWTQSPNARFAFGMPMPQWRIKIEPLCH